VLQAPLLHGGGPEVCFHLMSILSVPDERVALVDMALAAVETVELLGAMGFRLLPIDPAERETQAANVLSLGNGRVVAIAENVRTNERLAAAGLDVRTFPGDEICQNGSGGPTCLSRPLLRA
ncbi:MAG TPA: arginine deiminase family protein, partial [Candidatus Saccharimonadales bacterium]|nr:arginine deiminase family protein [Candidatus Saccharimonadales bacterium]